MRSNALRSMTRSLTIGNASARNHGHAPLDHALGVTADRIRANLLAVSTVLGTQMP
jgi:hypothetical protein